MTDEPAEQRTPTDTGGATTPTPDAAEHPGQTTGSDASGSATGSESAEASGSTASFGTTTGDHTAGPPPGATAGPPPGATTGYLYAARYGLIRPQHGRYVAGVCAAIGRATRTDPVFWRVILAVLGFFGGIGILFYLAVWLLTPAEGDSAAPVEAMLGRGRSSTSPVTVLLLGILFVILFGLVVADEFRAILLGGAIIIGAALLLNRDRGEVSPAQPGTAFGPAPTTASTGPVPPTQSAFTTEAQSGPPPAMSPPVPPHPGVGLTGPAAYRPPFAPHGPYGPYVPPGSPPPPRPAPPKPPKPPRESSPLGAAIVSLVFLAIGVVAMLELATVIDIPTSAYFAITLAIIALGLLIGTWFGRARWLIALGLVVTLALGIASVAESARWRPDAVEWTPASYEELADHYEVNFLDATLDLTRIDFTDRNTEVHAEINAGKLIVILPPEVDVSIQAEVNAGAARLFGRESGGVGTVREATDVGIDGPGGGNLQLRMEVNAGAVEVTR